MGRRSGRRRHPARRRRRAGFCRRRRYPRALRCGEGGRRLAGKILGHRIPFECFDRALSEAGDRADGRRRHGRRRRPFGPCIAPHRHRALVGRHAGSRDRLFSRRRRLLRAGAGAWIYRYLSGADRRARGCRRRHLLRPRRPAHSGGAAGRDSQRRWPTAAATTTSRRGSTNSQDRPRPAASPRRGSGSTAAMAPTPSRRYSIGWRNPTKTRRARHWKPCAKCRRPRSRSHCET